MFRVSDIDVLTWTITGTVSGSAVDFDFGHIGGEPEYERGLNGRIATDPCSGAHTWIGRTDGTTPKRRATLRAHIGIENDQTQDQNLAELLNLWVNGGPYTLTMPTGRTISFIFDPQTWREQRLTDRGYRVTVGIAET